MLLSPLRSNDIWRRTESARRRAKKKKKKWLLNGFYQESESICLGCSDIFRVLIHAFDYHPVIRCHVTVPHEFSWFNLTYCGALIGFNRLDWLTELFDRVSVGVVPFNVFYCPFVACVFCLPLSLCDCCCSSGFSDCRRGWFLRYSKRHRCFISICTILLLSCARVQRLPSWPAICLLSSLWWSLSSVSPLLVFVSMLCAVDAARHLRNCRFRNGIRKSLEIS